METSHQELQLCQKQKWTKRTTKIMILNSIDGWRSLHVPVMYGWTSLTVMYSWRSLPVMYLNRVVYLVFVTIKHVHVAEFIHQNIHSSSSSNASADCITASLECVSITATYSITARLESIWCIHYNHKLLAQNLYTSQIRSYMYIRVSLESIPYFHYSHMLQVGQILHQL